MSGKSSMWKRDTDDQKGRKWTAKMRVCVEIFVSKNTYLLSPLSQSFLFLVFRFPKLLFFIAGIGSGSRLTFCVYWWGRVLAAWRLACSCADGSLLLGSKWGSKQTHPPSRWPNSHAMRGPRFRAVRSRVERGESFWVHFPSSFLKKALISEKLFS